MASAFSCAIILGNLRIIKTLAIQKVTPFTNHLEIETYTWGVLPASVQVPLNESIIREITWVQSILEI